MYSVHLLYIAADLVILIINNLWPQWSLVDNFEISKHCTVPKSRFKLLTSSCLAQAPSVWPIWPQGVPWGQNMGSYVWGQTLGPEKSWILETHGNTLFNEDILFLQIVYVHACKQIS